MVEGVEFGVDAVACAQIVEGLWEMGETERLYPEKYKAVGLCSLSGCRVRFRVRP